MSSNAWKVALSELFGEDALARMLDANPEPPAFRAAVEAEAERVKLAIAKRLDEEADMTPCKEDAGVIRGCANLVRVDFSYDAADAVEAERGEVVIRAAVAEYLLRHPNEGPDERLGRAAAARGIMVRLGLYSEFEQALDYAAFQSASHRDAGSLCSDCPPLNYPTDKTRCEDCPRRALLSRIGEGKP